MSLTKFDKTPYIVTVLMLFPLIYQSMLSGIKNVKTELIEVYLLDSKINFKVIKNVYIPLIKQNLYVGILQSISLGIKVLVVTEFTVMTNNSIGKALIDEKNNLNFNRVFAYSFLLIIIVMILEKTAKKIKIYQ